MRSREESGGPAGCRRTVVVLGAIYLFDSWFLGQGVLSLLVSSAGLAVLGVGAIVALVRGRRAWAASRALRALIYILLAVATVATLRFHARTVEARASQVLAACRAYHAKHENYPAHLTDLVPEFLADVPRAKYTMMWGEFSYWTSSPESHTLMYVALPPFGRHLYELETEKWSQLD